MDQKLGGMQLEDDCLPEKLYEFFCSLFFIDETWLILLLPIYLVKKIVMCL